LVILQLGLINLYGQFPNCPVRPTSGTLAENPPSLASSNGVLSVDLTLRNAPDQYGFMHYCYDYRDGGHMIEAPTLRLNPGDQLVLNLTNSINSSTALAPDTMPEMEAEPGNAGSGDCPGGVIRSSDTNLHFHGLNVPPVCHQDDVINTIIASGAPPFQFKIRIPPNEPPGLYWYHPHPHGFTTTQVEGGAAGALIVEGIEKVRPEVAGLQERVLILRQQFYNQNSWLPGPFQFTLNFQSIVPEVFPLPLIQMTPGKKEFWRFLNASTQGFVRLQVNFGTEAQTLELISLDGVPLAKPEYVKAIQVPPAGRAEFIVPGPQPGAVGQLVTAGVWTGKTGNKNAFSQLANIVTHEASSQPAAWIPPVSAPPAVPQRFAGLETAVPTARRNLYFSEIQSPTGTIKFFITVEGQKPKTFNPGEPPAIVTHVGAVEDWTIENRAEEMHAFHIHQIHFLVMAVNGKPLPEPALQDTISVDPWSGQGPYPSVTLRMDFRDPEIAGTFVYHCHILDHEDAGMMAKILVKPADDEKPVARVPKPVTTPAAGF
jgi:FtsP/CotA-like multicopper oxidase with cupredoxin domain